MPRSELLFQLEQVPVEAPKKGGHITVSYFEHHAEAELGVGPAKWPV